MRNIPIAVASALLPTCIATAQNFNIDMAVQEGVPGNGYAAAGSPGVWNDIANPFPDAAPLVATSGAATDVTLETTARGDDSWNGSPNGNKTSGDDEALMDDFWSQGAESAITLRELTPGFYTIHVYASAPDAIDFFTDISVNGVNTVTGTCPGDSLYNEFAGELAPDDPCVDQADLGVLLANYGCIPPP